ncbi:MAG: ABC-type transport auxiliary lipoprotein family protein [Cyanobacteria bacterium]|nr:ABC-type transport auxiliary lipoprotein family protein [Cyanobacteriota bacterium]
MTIRTFFFFTLVSLFHLTGCSPVKTTVTNQYKLEAYSNATLSHKTHASILITQPEAMPGYQTNQMLYVKKPYEISSFANNTWISPPGDMLYPLIIQSIQKTGTFYAVSSLTNSEQTDYRLDTQLLELQQNFLIHPSRIEFKAKSVLTDIKSNRVIASIIISENLPCPRESPYGGVLAANEAMKKFTAQLAAFVVRHVKSDPKLAKI